VKGRIGTFNMQDIISIKNIICAFDNTHGSCYIEQTKSKKKAKQWCKGEIEANEL
jgi:hypothetical protein